MTVAIGDPCYPSGRALQINGMEIVEAGKNNDVMLKKGEFLKRSKKVCRLALCCTKKKNDKRRLFLRVSTPS